MTERGQSLAGGAVIVTGASSGIGRAAAVAASRAGARVTCCGRNAARLAETLALLAGEGHGIWQFDAADTESAADAVTQIAGVMGPISGLVHCAGISSHQLLRDLDFNRANEMLRVNCLAFMSMAKAVCRRGRYAPGMSVVAVSSLASLSPDPGLSAYAASKAALDAAVSALAREYAPRGIRFNSICPSFVNTPMLDAQKKALGEDAFAERVAKSMPLGLIEPADVAEAAIFLLSDASKRITGVHLAMDSGGRH